MYGSTSASVVSIDSVMTSDTVKRAPDSVAPAARSDPAALLSVSASRPSNRCSVPTRECPSCRASTVANETTRRASAEYASSTARTLGALRTVT